MVRTVFLDTDVISSQFNSLPSNRFSFGFLCGQSTRSERDFIHYIIDGLTSQQTEIDSLTTNKDFWAKIIEITSSLCAGLSVIGFYCRAKSDVFKSSNFTLKMRRLFEILQSALRTYSPWSLSQSSHRILLQSEIGNAANKWLVKTMDMDSNAVSFRSVELKTFDSKSNANFCFTTTIPIQFHLRLNALNIDDDQNIKLIENQFEQQWKQYIEHLKESLLLMDDRLLPLDKVNLPSKGSESSMDIQWLAPFDGPAINVDDGDRIYFQFDGSASLRFFTCHNDLTGDDLRQYFLEDLFRSMLIRLNLALINYERQENETNVISKLILPRRVYVNQPMFLSAYQLPHEPLRNVIDSFQENFKITSIIEDDLEVAEEFPPALTSDERLKNFNSNSDEIEDKEKISTGRKEKNIFRTFTEIMEKFVGTGNTLLVTLLVTILALLIGIMLRLFT